MYVERESESVCVKERERGEERERGGEGYMTLYI